MESLASRELKRRLQFHFGIASKATVPCGNCRECYGCMESLASAELKRWLQFHVGIASTDTVPCGNCKRGYGSMWELQVRLRFYGEPVLPTIDKKAIIPCQNCK
jgi:uncharacterized CHY-type Zn-finger protein